METNGKLHGCSVSFKTDSMAKQGRSRRRIWEPLRLNNIYESDKNMNDYSATAPESLAVGDSVVQQKSAHLYSKTKILKQAFQEKRSTQFRIPEFQRFENEKIIEWIRHKDEAKRREKQEKSLIEKRKYEAQRKVPWKQQGNVLRNIDPLVSKLFHMKPRQKNVAKPLITIDSDCSRNSTLRDIGFSVFEQNAPLSNQTTETEQTTSHTHTRDESVLSNEADAKEAADRSSYRPSSSDSLEGTMVIYNRNGTSVCALLQSTKIEPEIYVGPSADQLMCHACKPTLPRGGYRLAARLTHSETIKNRSIDGDQFNSTGGEVSIFGGGTALQSPAGECDSTLCHGPTIMTNIQLDQSVIESQPLVRVASSKINVSTLEKLGPASMSCVINKATQLLGPTAADPKQLEYTTTRFTDDRQSQEGLVVSAVEAEECEQWFERWCYAQL